MPPGLMFDMPDKFWFELGEVMLDSGIMYACFNRGDEAISSDLSWLFHIMYYWEA